MELNVDTKRLPSAQETTWTRELKQNNWYAPQVQIVEFYNWLNAAIVEKRPIRSDQYSKKQTKINKHEFPPIELQIMRIADEKPRQ